MEIMWDHVFDKPESSGEKPKREETEEGKLKEADDNREKPDGGEDHPQYTTPGYNSRNQPHYPRYEYTPHTQFPLHLFPERMDNSESRMDDATKRVRVEVPDFHGKMDPYAFRDWLTSLDDYFEWFNLTSERKVRFVKMKLKGQARVWWHSVEEQLHRLRRAPILDWEEMRLKLQEKYLPIDYEESLFEELLTHRQGNMTVDEYTNRFHELSIRSQVSETERQSIARYKTGLREDIRRELLTVRLVSVDEAYQIAIRIEQQNRGTTGRRTNTGWSNITPRSPQNPIARATVNRDRFATRNVSINDKFLQEREDRKGKAVAGARPERGKEECYRCGGKGHYAVVCPTREPKPALLCKDVRDAESQEFPHEQQGEEEKGLIEDRLEG
jgi:hypothetical protein